MKKMQGYSQTLQKQFSIIKSIFRWRIAKPPPPPPTPDTHKASFGFFGWRKQFFLKVFLTQIYTKLEIFLLSTWKCTFVRVGLLNCGGRARKCNFFAWKNCQQIAKNFMKFCLFTTRDNLPYLPWKQNIFRTNYFKNRLPKKKYQTALRNALLVHTHDLSSKKNCQGKLLFGLPTKLFSCLFYCMINNFLILYKMFWKLPKSL